MDDRNFSNIFRKATGHFFCPACGSKFAGSEIESIEHHNDGYLVSVKCSNCSLKLSMQVITKGFSDLTPSEPTIENEITIDEIIDFHDKLGRFDGNFRREFAGKIDQSHLF